MKVILPKQRVDICSLDLPLFFFGGPILGADDWQYPMSRLLQEKMDDFFLATPSCRYGEGHPLEEFHAEVTGEIFERQLSWERHYLDLASRDDREGCIIFWLPCESKTNPRSDGLPYAMDTRGELGELRGRLVYDRSLKVVIGAEKEFPGLSQIQRNFNEALNCQFPIYESMEETVDAAVKMAVRAR